MTTFAPGTTRFVAGSTAGDAAAVVRELAADGLAATVGRFAPVATDAATARATADAYAEVARLLWDLPTGTRLEVDLPHLGVDVDPALATDLLCRIGRALPAGSALQCGAEDATRTDAVLGAVVTARRRGLPVRATVQVNLHRSPVDVDLLVQERVPVRLVKGGFPETPRVAEQDPAAVTARVRLLAGVLTARGADFTLATHDPDLQDRSALLDPAPPVETLLGVLPDRARALARTRQVRVYVPFGRDDDGYVAKRLADERRASC